MVKDPPSNAGDVGLIPGWGTQILRAVGQLERNLHASSSEPSNSRASVLRSLHEPVKTPRTTTKTQQSQKEKGKKEQLQGVREKFGGWDDIYTLIYIKLITNKDLLFSTGNST